MKVVTLSLQRQREQPVASNVLSAPVRERVAVAISSERRTAEALAKVVEAGDLAEGAADVERLRQMVRDHLAALATLRLDAEDMFEAADPKEPDGPPTVAISAAERAFAAVTRAYASLHATARVLYEPDLCDLAERHLAEAIGGLQVLAALNTAALAHELNADGLYCRCICPSCSIGACGCVRSSISSVADVWGWPGLPSGEGVELRSPPRPGSQLAAAGIEKHDRVASVDGVVVHSLAEQQAALRRHPFGETALLSIKRSTGEIVDVEVQRVEAP
jgi:PDZ domain